MKKLISTIAILIGLSVSAQAGTQLYKVGNIEGGEWNELLNTSTETDIRVSAGIDPEGYKLVRIKVDGVFEDMNYNLWTNAQGLAGDFSGYEEWLYVLTKALEWAEVAKSNGVDHRAEIGDCGTYDMKCTANFIAIKDGQSSAVKFFMESKKNKFYTAEPIVMIDQIAKLKTLITTGAENKFKELDSKPKVDKSKLFN